MEAFHWVGLSLGGIIACLCFAEWRYQAKLSESDAGDRNPFDQPRRSFEQRARDLEGV